VNFDHVDLVREKLMDQNGEITYPVPGEGENYTDDPGRFVVYLGENTLDSETGKGRGYGKIMEIMADVQKGRLASGPGGGGGLDWLEVAAADIYNSSSNSVYSCVWEINVEELDCDGRAHKYIVKLNPYSKNCRLNLRSLDGNGFRSYHWRSLVIKHEALHCYHLLPGRLVDDEELDCPTAPIMFPRLTYRRPDDLFVCNQDGGANMDLRYSWDNASRGFLKPNRNGYHRRDYLSGWLNGYSGDKYRHEPMLATFIVRLDTLLDKATLKKILTGENCSTKIPSPLPEHLPLPFGVRSGITADPYLGYVRLFLYRFPWCDRPGRTRQIMNPFIKHRGSSIYTCRKGDGEFYYKQYWLEATGYSGTDGMEIYEKLQQKNRLSSGPSYPAYGLYVMIVFNYPDVPYEFDASYYGISN
jgi:hypothetical protein